MYYQCSYYSVDLVFMIWIIKVFVYAKSKSISKSNLTCCTTTSIMCIDMFNAHYKDILIRYKFKLMDHLKRNSQKYLKMWRNFCNFINGAYILPALQSTIIWSYITFQLICCWLIKLRLSPAKMVCALNLQPVYI